MGSFYTRCKIENSVDRKRSAVVQKLLVDTGSEHTWLPTPTLERIGIQREKKDLTFVMANGQQITRGVGFGIIRVGGSFTIDEVVFGEKGDLLLLGSRTLEGLNLTIDPVRKKLVGAGPLPAAATGNCEPVSNSSLGLGPERVAGDLWLGHSRATPGPERAGGEIHAIGLV